MKKIVSLLTVLMLSLQMTTVFAADNPTVAVGNSTAKAGEDVEVTVTLSDCTKKWMDLQLEVGYNSDVMSIVSAETTVSGMSFAAGKTDRNPHSFVFAGASGSSYNGVLVTYVFHIADNAAPGTYPLTINYIQEGDWGPNEDGWDCNYDENFEALNLVYVDGSITVESDGPTLTAKKTSDGVDITATAVPADSKFIVASYDANGNLVEVEVINAAETATSTVTGDNVKVMWWDSLTSLTSIVDAIDL